MWHYKLRQAQLCIPKKYLEYRFSSEAVKSSAINQTQDAAAASFQISEKGKRVVQPNESILSSGTAVKTKPFLKSTLTDVTDSRTVSFDDIPGPDSLRLISKFWGTIPVMGTELTVSVIQYLLSGGKFFGGILSWGGNKRFFKKFFDVYGPVVRLHGPFGSDVVLLSRPEHASAVFQNEGPYPVRSCLDSVEKYRLEYRRYRQAGPFLMYGPDWERLRKTIEEPLQKTVGKQFHKIGAICEEFTDRIIAIRNKQEEMPNNFRNEIYKWCLECLCSVTLNTKLGFLDPCGLSPTSDPGRLLIGLTSATDAIRKCEYGFHLWKFMETPAWKSLVRNCDTIDSILDKHLQRAISGLRDKNERKSNMDDVSLLEFLLLKEGIVAEDVMTVLLDMFLIGANATAHTVAFLLYHLAKNPRCQINLYEEVKKCGENLSREKLDKMRYLHACIKESLRLDPPIPILSRRLNSDVVIHHYLIPKGTHILFATHLNSAREEFFEDAAKFRPERWLSDELGGFGSDFQAFASMPFGHGPKACLAKELAELQLALLLVKVVKRYKIEYDYGDMQSSNEFLASPTKPLKFRFVQRV